MPTDNKQPSKRPEKQPTDSHSLPDLSSYMSTYSDGKQFSELTQRRAGQTKPLFDLRAEATEKESAKK